jgi:hypothetical protein
VRKPGCLRCRHRLNLHNDLAATMPADRRLYQRRIETTDTEMDPLVHELYGFTEGEIAIVEEATK